MFYVAKRCNTNQLLCHVIFVMQHHVKFLIPCCYEENVSNFHCH